MNHTEEKRNKTKTQKLKEMDDLRATEMEKL